MSEPTTQQVERENECETNASGPRDFLSGLLIGGLAGAIAMWMLAPQSGKRTRAKMQLKGIELRDEATEAVEDGMAQIQTRTHQVKVDVRKGARKLRRHAHA